MKPVQTMLKMVLGVVLLLSLVVAAPVQSAPQRAGLAFGEPYTQDFDTLANSGVVNAWLDDSTLPGWYLAKTFNGTNVSSYRVGDGSANNAEVYSFGSGASTERALGSIAEGVSGAFYYGLLLQNTTGSPITSLTVSFTGEQWRDGGSAIPNDQTIEFRFKLAASAPALLDSGYVIYDALDFTSPVFSNKTAGAALDGNLPANRRLLSSTISGLTWENNAYIMLRWMDSNNGGNDHALAIDDLRISVPTTSAVSLGATTARPAGGFPVLPLLLSGVLLGVAALLRRRSFGG